MSGKPLASTVSTRSKPNGSYFASGAGGTATSRLSRRIHRDADWAWARRVSSSMDAGPVVHAQLNDATEFVKRTPSQAEVVPAWKKGDHRLVSASGVGYHAQPEATESKLRTAHMVCGSDQQNDVVVSAPQQWLHISRVLVRRAAALLQNEIRSADAERLDFRGIDFGVGLAVMIRIATADNDLANPLVGLARRVVRRGPPDPEHGIVGGNVRAAQLPVFRAGAQQHDGITRAECRVGMRWRARESDTPHAGTRHPGETQYENRRDAHPFEQG